MYLTLLKFILRFLLNCLRFVLTDMFILIYFTFFFMNYMFFYEFVLRFLFLLFLLFLLFTFLDVFPRWVKIHRVQNFHSRSLTSVQPASVGSVLPKSLT